MIYSNSCHILTKYSNSFKRKHNKIFFTDLTNVFYGLSVSRFMSMMCTACHTNMWLAVMNQVQTSLLSDLNVWNRRPFIAGQVCQQVHFVIFHLQHATHMNWKNAKDLFHVLPFLNKASCVYNLSPVAFVDPVCSKVVLRIGFVDDSCVVTGLMNNRQLHILFNSAKTWHVIVCWYMCFPPNLPELNLKLFLTSEQNNFSFSLVKFGGKHRNQQTFTCQVLAELNKIWSCLIFIKLYQKRQGVSHENYKT